VIRAPFPAPQAPQLLHPQHLGLRSRLQRSLWGGLIAAVLATLGDLAPEANVAKALETVQRLAATR